MSTRAETDRRLSIASDEFIWDSAEHTEAHRFLAAPVMRTLAQHGVRSVLDLGCGNGSLTAHIAAAGFEATGLDHSESGIRIAAQHHPGVTYAQHDITQPLPSNYGGRYDAVVSVEVMEHLLLPRMLLLNAKDDLSSGLKWFTA